MARSSPSGRLQLAGEPAVSILPAAGVQVVSVNPEDDTKKAITLMQLHDYSQLPVMAGPRTVKGVISWKSLGSRLAHGQKCELVKDAMSTKIPELGSQESLYKAINLIERHDFVLVRDRHNVISGIITGYDLSVQMRQFAEPFLRLEEIERSLRKLLEGHVEQVDFERHRAPGDDRSLEGLEDLTMGHLEYLLADKEIWSRLNLRLERAVVVRELQKVRLARNAIMHFRGTSDEAHDEDLATLKQFAHFLQRVLSTRAGG